MIYKTPRLGYIGDNDFSEFMKRMRKSKEKRRQTTAKIRSALTKIFERPVDQPTENAKRRRKRYRINNRPNWEGSLWHRLLNDPTYEDPTHRNGQLFRLRFRVPYPIFLGIVDRLKRCSEFKKGEYDCCHLRTTPIELLVLGCLRILGRGVCLDGIEEMSGISISTMRIFFHKFCQYFTTTMFPIHCRAPESPTEISAVLKEYEELGLPGCIGSTDCVHIAWDRSPHSLRFRYTGKEHFPTIAYEVSCTHSKRIISVTTGFPGAENDKTIVRMDSFVTNIHERISYADVTFLVTKEDGSEETVTGPYLLVDNGYHHWRCLQNPEKFSLDVPTILFSKHLESVRKDIECTFGILKGRFRILKIPVLFQSQAVIDNIFKTCCVLHNMILYMKNVDSRWEDDVNWGGEYGYHDIQDWGRIISVGIASNANNRRTTEMRLTPDLDLSSQGGFSSIFDSEEDVEETHTELRRKLITHFNKKLAQGLVRWN